MFGPRRVEVVDEEREKKATMGTTIFNVLFCC